MPLTTGVDAVTGGASDDTITANSVDTAGTDADTLSSYDSINGGAGTDTLNLYTNGGFNGDMASSVSITNVEIVNIFNEDGPFVTSGANIDASKFGGATQIWQNTSNTGVKSLASTTTAGFKDIAVDAEIGIAAAATATSASVVLSNVGNNVADGFDGNQSYIAIGGAALTAVNVSGTLAAKEETIYLDVAAGKDVTSVIVNSAFDTELYVYDSSYSDWSAAGVDVAGYGGTKQVKTLDASGSTGAMLIDGVSWGTDEALETIKTGAGDDEVTLLTTTAKDNAATLADETVAGMVDTGAGDDTITVDVSGDGKATVTAGEGDDTITVTDLASGGTTIDAGAGDDEVDVSAVTLTTKDSVQGGAGEADNLVIAASTSFSAANYLTLDAVASGFETLTFVGGDTTVDASQVSTYSKLVFKDETVDVDTITKVADSQTLVSAAATYADLVATSAGYVAASGSTAATYAGTLNFQVISGNDTFVTANADTANIAVSTKATVAADVAVTGTFGDLKTLNVTLTSTAGLAAGKATGLENIASLVMDQDGAEIDDKTLTALSKLTVSGSGEVTIDTSTVDADVESFTTKLVTIDLSGMTALVNKNKAGDQVTSDADTSTDYGYQNLSTSSVTLTDNVAQTVKLGGALDTVSTNSTYLKMDTIEGFELVADLVADATGKTADESKSDVIEVAGNVTFAKFTTTASSFAAALLAAGASADENLVFTFGNDTYVYQDLESDGISNDDVVIKLAGTYNLDLLVDVVG